GRHAGRLAVRKPAPPDDHPAFHSVVPEPSGTALRGPDAGVRARFVEGGSVGTGVPDGRRGTGRGAFGPHPGRATERGAQGRVHSYERRCLLPCPDLTGSRALLLV